MRISTIILLALALALVVSHAHAAQRNLAVAKSAGEQRRVALVIGNAAYQGITALKNPLNDAKDISDTLNKLGFEVIEVTNATQREMNLAIASFGQKLSTDTAALFFYAGHGLQVKGKNYLVPVDAQINSEAEVRAVTVDMDTVMDQLAASTMSIVILDACRNNPFERSFRKMGGGLAQMDAPKGSFIAYATSPGKTAADGDGRNGLFTQELLKQINEPGLELGMLMRKVRASVATRSGDAQMPWDSSSMTGAFYFKPDDGVQVDSLVPVPAQAARIKSKEKIEDDTWSAAEEANTVEAVNAYLAGYPKGRYVAQAKVKLAALKKQVQQPAPAQIATGREDGETALWNEAQKGTSREDYQAYLDQYPKGKYAALAKSRIKKIQGDAQAAAEQQAEQAWDAAQQENSEESYARYLKGYPGGRYVGLARARQEKLKNDLAAKEEAELWKKAESGNDRKAVEAYLNRYPSGRYLAAAGDKLEAIKEEEAKGPAMVAIPGKNYELGKYHVTRKEFAEFVNATGYDAGNSCYASTGLSWDNRSGNNWRNPGFTQDDSHPVTCVNWHDAQAYAQWLSRKTGRQYRLPTETEWEYACYGGSQSEYCGGNNIEAVAWYDGNSNKQTHPVGQKQANGYGLYDMSGNAWQWMENWYDGSRTDYGRALRGGSWFDAPQNVRAAFWVSYVPLKRDNGFGFRLARTLP
ncbi:SUMF1/EgtB/PvdO family nonheme iron enzyme [Candidatus Ferrigenium straubiae]|uniref:SUMF1/EgtB/PvdO family nonheme iron enzyme n=1 Tax=Candidatus Ferrigenium straubiae TaxID=2919506 RepID=UPI003F4AAF01